MAERSAGAGQKRVCGHPQCRNTVPPGRTHYCSARCRKTGRPARRRFRRRMRATYQAGTPFGQFVAAAQARKQLRDHKSEKAQALARRLVAEGAIAYENRDGLIRDVGAPKDPADAGRVFSRRPAEVVA